MEEEPLSFFRFPNSGGISPENRVAAQVKSSRAVRYPISGGMVLLIWHCSFAEG
jgi:hypothetical protein